jgi:DNA-binding NarL/FixJ family response regulator
MTRPRVLLAEDHAETLDLLSLLLQREFEVLGSVQDGHALISAAQQMAPDVIVTDISMPGLDGIAAAAIIRRVDPLARIVLVTMHTEPSLVARGLAAGALGYVLKLAAGDDLVPAVHAALEGRRYVSAALCSARGDDEPRRPLEP